MAAVSPLCLFNADSVCFLSLTSTPGAHRSRAQVRAGAKCAGAKCVAPMTLHVLVSPTGSWD